MADVMAKNNLGEHQHAIQQPPGWGMVYSVASQAQQASDPARPQDGAQATIEMQEMMKAIRILEKAKSARGKSINEPRFPPPKVNQSKLNIHRQARAPPQFVQRPSHPTPAPSLPSSGAHSQQAQVSMGVPCQNMPIHHSGMGPTQAMQVPHTHFQHPAAPAAKWPSNAPGTAVATQPMQAKHGGGRAGVGQSVAMRQPMVMPQNPLQQHGPPCNDAFYGDLGLGTDDDESMDDDALFAAVDAVESAQAAHPGQAAPSGCGPAAGLPTQPYNMPQVHGQTFESAIGGGRPTSQTQQFVAPAFAGVCRIGTMLGGNTTVTSMTLL
eukprot:jgi/Ulvmu1/6160/UM028_0016.1